MPGLLAGRTAIVTGSSRGIGRATALEFARQGARVVVNYRRSGPDAESAVRVLEKAGYEHEGFIRKLYRKNERLIDAHVLARLR